MLKILVVEDEEHNRIALHEWIERLGHHVFVVSDGHSALDWLLKYSCDLILCDVRMPGLDGFQLYEAIKSSFYGQCSVPAIAFMTAYGRLDEGVKALRNGAIHFLSKPIHKKDLVELINEVESRSKKSAIARGAESIHSRAFANLLDQAAKASRSEGSIVIHGESGTGKEWLARKIHEWSDRRTGPFVAWSAGAAQEALFESDLFGFQRGAFTGAETSRQGLLAQANSGTLFLDEIDSLSMGCQVKLLRVVESKKYSLLGSTAIETCNVRWIAASSQPLQPLIEAGRFRQDLWYRLNVFELETLPLRKREEDIPTLIHQFLQEIAKVELNSKDSWGVHPDALEALRSYSWPGNLRELKNVLNRAAVLSEAGTITLDSLPDVIAKRSSSRPMQVEVGSSLRSVEDTLISETLRVCNGDRTRAALMLGVAPKTIYRWLQRQTYNKSNLLE